MSRKGVMHGSPSSAHLRIRTVASLQFVYLNYHYYRFLRLPAILHPPSVRDSSPFANFTRANYPGKCWISLFLLYFEDRFFFNGMNERTIVDRSLIGEKRVVSRSRIRETR